MSKKIVYGVIIFLVVAGFCAVGITATYLIKKPLAPHLSLNLRAPTSIFSKLDEPTQEPLIMVPTATPEQNLNPTAVSPTIVASTDTIPTDIPTPMTTSTQSVIINADPSTPSPTPAVNDSANTSITNSSCGGSGSMIILVAGIDSGSGAYLQGADAIRIMQVNFDQSKVRVISLPNNLLISSPTLENLNLHEISLGSIYDYIQKNAVGNPEDIKIAATNYLAQAIYEVFGVIVDHYIAIDLDTFMNFVDTLGGIEINIPVDYHDLSARNQVLDKNQILEYMRFSDPTVEDQFVRQNLVISAIRSQILKPTNIIHAPALISDFSTSVKTDLSPQMILNLSCLAQNISSDSLHFLDISPMTTPIADDLLQPDLPQIREYLSNELNTP
jgi:polyisoprenyl-teichoic acid--peptidoglycan teichoic acid transferase